MVGRGGAGARAVAESVSDGKWAPSRAVLVPTACVGLAAVSLLLPWDLSFDPWGWVMWGREITSSDIPFNTALYPAWKPLAVMVTTGFSLFGNAAPDLWLVGARTGAIVRARFTMRARAPRY